MKLFHCFHFFFIYFFFFISVVEKIQITHNSILWVQWRVAEVCQRLEHDMQVLGVAAIEDRLQVVPCVRFPRFFCGIVIYIWFVPM